MTKIKEGGSGSGDFGHAGRAGERGGSAPQADKDPNVSKRPHAQPGPLEPHEVQLGQRIDAGELGTTELKDGKMVPSKWPKEWPD